VQLRQPLRQPLDVIERLENANALELIEAAASGSELIQMEEAVLDCTDNSPRRRDPGVFVAKLDIGRR
jgi:hypothetical protein